MRSQTVQLYSISLRSNRQPVLELTNRSTVDLYTCVHKQIQYLGRLTGPGRSQEVEKARQLRRRMSGLSHTRWPPPLVGERARIPKMLSPEALTRGSPKVEILSDFSIFSIIFFPQISFGPESQKTFLEFSFQNTLESCYLLITHYRYQGLFWYEYFKATTYSVVVHRSLRFWEITLVQPSYLKHGYSIMGVTFMDSCTQLVSVTLVTGLPQDIEAFSRPEQLNSTIEIRLWARFARPKPNLYVIWLTWEGRAEFKKERKSFESMPIIWLAWEGRAEFKKDRKSFESIPVIQLAWETTLSLEYHSRFDHIPLRR